jgi:hypothetical protein
LGFVLLASNATHYDENMKTMRAYPVVDLAQMVEGIERGGRARMHFVTLLNVSQQTVGV